MSVISLRQWNRDEIESRKKSRKEEKGKKGKRREKRQVERRSVASWGECSKVITPLPCLCGMKAVTAVT